MGQDKGAFPFQGYLRVLCNTHKAGWPDMPRGWAYASWKFKGQWKDTDNALWTSKGEHSSLETPLLSILSQDIAVVWPVVVEKLGEEQNSAGSLRERRVAQDKSECLAL